MLSRLLMTAAAMFVLSAPANAENIVLQCGSGTDAKVFAIDTHKGTGIDVLLDHYLVVAVSGEEFRIADVTEEQTGQLIKYRILRTDGTLYEGNPPTAIGNCVKNPGLKF